MQDAAHGQLCGKCSGCKVHCGPLQKCPVELMAGVSVCPCPAAGGAHGTARWLAGGTRPWDQGGEGRGPFLLGEGLLWGLRRTSFRSAEKKVSLGQMAKPAQGTNAAFSEWKVVRTIRKLWRRHETRVCYKETEGVRGSEETGAGCGSCEVV